MIGMTIAVGIGGALLGGLVGRLVWGEQYQCSILLAVAGAALIVWIMGRTRRGRRSNRPVL